MASVLRVDLQWLLVLVDQPTTPSPAAASPPITSPDARRAIEQRLERGGHDSGLAADFAAAGIGSAVLKTWLDRFDAAEALIWLHAGAKPNAAWQAKKAGLTPETFGSPVAKDGESALIDLDASPAVAATWLTYSDVGTARAWLRAGWDLLAALAWTGRGVKPEVAFAWHQLGVTPNEVSMMPAEVNDVTAAGPWLTSGIPVGEWSLWMARGFAPAEAGRWHLARVPAAESPDFRRLVGDPERSGWYRAQGIGPHVAQRWEQAGLSLERIGELMAEETDPTKAHDIATQPVAAEPTPGKRAKGKQRVRLQAEAFGITEAEVIYLSQQVSAAAAGLSGTKAEKASRAARRLSITPAELKLLRAALGSQFVAERYPARERQLARHVIGLTPLQTTYTKPKPAPGTTPPKVGKNPTNRTSSSLTTKPARRPPATSPVSTGASFLRRRDWSADSKVYVTPWGDRVHRYHDCHGMRGFRHANEPDPEIIIVSLRDPVCAARPACRKCFDWSVSRYNEFDQFMEDLHGPADPRPTWNGRGRRE